MCATVAVVLLVSMLVLCCVRSELVIKVRQGKNANLLCDTEPQSTVAWMYRRQVMDAGEYICRGGHVVIKYYGKYELIRADPVEFTYTLTVLNTTFDDEGIYSCIEKNGVGASSAVRLKITSTCLNSSDCVTQEPEVAKFDGKSYAEREFLIAVVIAEALIFASVVSLMIVWHRRRLGYRSAVNQLRERQLHDKSSVGCDSSSRETSSSVVQQL